MTDRLVAGRNPHRPGSVTYTRLHQAELKRRAALAQATVSRATKPEARRRAKRRFSTVQRELRAIEVRQEFRSKLNVAEQREFDLLTIEKQRRLAQVSRTYAEGVPQDLPDPFAGTKRDVLWRLSYATRAGIRSRRTV